MRHLHIVIGCHEFYSVSGMPIYILRLSKELSRLGHRVSIFGLSIGGKMLDMGLDAGLEIRTWQDMKEQRYSPDILFLNEHTTKLSIRDFKCPAFNLLHSKYPLDAPIEDGIEDYFACRQDVADYHKKECIIAPAPIPFDQFKKLKQDKHSTYRILLLGTVDPIRKPMISDLLKRAEADSNIELRIRGKHNINMRELNTDIPENVTVDRTETITPEKEISWADEVAGIFVGLVTLEAWAMGKKTSVYDEWGHYEMMEPPADFKERYDVKSVAQVFLNRFYTSTS